MGKIKNIIILIVVGVVLFLVYNYFFKAPADVGLLVSSSSISNVSDTKGNSNFPVSDDFLTLLLSVKSIKLDDTIFSDNAFNTLRDSSITLVPDGNEGRPNPFAPLGVDNTATPLNVVSAIPPDTSSPPETKAPVVKP